MVRWYEGSKGRRCYGVAALRLYGVRASGCKVQI